VMGWRTACTSVMTSRLATETSEHVSIRQRPKGYTTAKMAELGRLEFVAMCTRICFLTGGEAS
jgi:hypothetical protein